MEAPETATRATTRARTKDSIMLDTAEAPRFVVHVFTAVCFACLLSAGLSDCASQQGTFPADLTSQHQGEAGLAETAPRGRAAITNRAAAPMGSLDGCQVNSDRSISCSPNCTVVSLSPYFWMSCTVGGGDPTGGGFSGSGFEGPLPGDTITNPDHPGGGD